MKQIKQNIQTNPLPFVFGLITIALIAGIVFNAYWFSTMGKSVYGH